MSNLYENNYTGNYTLGQNIRDIRTSLKLTQEEFAEKLDLNPQFISQIETGKVGISIDNAIKICNYAKCSSVKLFKGLIPATEVENYEFLSDRDKILINQLINNMLNTK